MLNGCIPGRARSWLIGLCLIGAVMSASVTTRTNATEAGAMETVPLWIGEVRLIDVAQVADIVSGSPEVLEAKLLSPQQLVIKAKGTGIAEVMLLDTAGHKQHLRFHVNRRINPRLELALRALTATEPDLKLAVTAPFSLVTGRVSVAGETHLLALQQDHPELLVQVTATEPSAPMIELSVKILELKRQSASHIGVQWDTSVAGPLLSRLAGSRLQLPLELGSRIQLLERQGRAKVLAEPRLTTQSGAAASFLAGGEIPIPQVLAQGMQDVSFREYGIRLNMTPLVTQDGLLQTEVTAEVSSIDGAVSVNGVPGILTRKTSSVILAQNNETLAISGLLSDDMHQTLNRFPALSELPVLGALFRSHDFQRQQTELVVLVTPRLLADKQQQARKHTSAEQKLQDFRRLATCVGLQE